MKLSRTYIGWAVAVVVGLVITAPASLANLFLRGAPVCLVDSSGSLWSGSGWLAGRRSDGGATPIMRLSWKVEWRDGPAVALATAEGVGSLQAGFGGFQLDMPPFAAPLPSLPLPTTLAGYLPSGRLRGLRGRFDCSYGLACRGEGSFRLEDPVLGLFPSDRLGDIAVALKADGRGETIVLTADGRAAVAGDATLRRQDGQWNVSGNARATAGASPGLASTLVSLKLTPAKPLTLGVSGRSQPSR